MLEDAAQVLVENHPESEARLVDVFVEALADAHQDDLNDLLELVAGHLHFVEQTLWSRNLIASDGQSPGRVSQLVGSLKATFDAPSASTSFTLAELSLRHKLVNLIVHFLNHWHFLVFIHQITRRSVKLLVQGTLLIALRLINLEVFAHIGHSTVLPILTLLIDEIFAFLGLMP